jgi:hypothetical protein
MRYRATLQAAELLLGAGQNNIKKHNWFLIVWLLLLVGGRFTQFCDK